MDNKRNFLNNVTLIHFLFWAHCLHCVFVWSIECSNWPFIMTVEWEHNNSNGEKKTMTASKWNAWKTEPDIAAVLSSQWNSIWTRFNTCSHKYNTEMWKWCYWVRITLFSVTIRINGIECAIHKIYACVCVSHR